MINTNQSIITLDIINEKIKQAEKFEAENTRGYEHDNWYAVNVKCSSSQFADLEKIKKHLEFSSDPKLKREEQEHIDQELTEENIDRLFWDIAIPDFWDIMREDISQAQTDTDHPLYKHINYINLQSRHDKYVLCLGRSGGWACFQTKLNDIISNLSDIDQEQLDNDQTDAINQLQELENCLNATTALIEYIKHAKQNFDGSESITGFIQYNILDQYIEDQANKRQDHKTYLLPVIEAKLLSIESTIQEYAPDKLADIKRNTNSIRSVVSK